MTYLKDFVEHCINNSTETMEYFDDIIITREYNTPEMEEFRKVVNENFNKFCFNNGLFQKNRLKFDDLKGQEEAFMILIGVINKMPKNRYLQQILKFYYNKLDCKMEDVKLEDIGIKFMDNYYQDLPPIYAKIPKIDKQDLIRPVQTATVSGVEKLLKHLKDFIVVGSSVQFNVDGFPRNEMLYLLYGLAICSALNKDFKSFRDLINHLKSFIQIYLPTKCFNPIAEEKENVNDNYYNLITYLKTKDGNYNYRYKCAEKYFRKEIPHSAKGTNTKYIEGEDGSSYLLTAYKTKEDMEKVWDKLEEEYKKANLSLSDDLIAMWFDGQLLTRSTCLIGCMLIIIKYLKECKRVIFKKDEMPDWCSIAGLDFNTTFTTEDFKKIGFEDKELGSITLKDVLDLLKIYVLNVRKN